MALVKLSDYYPAEEGASICDALDALSEAVEIKLTDNPDEYFDGSPCALGPVIKETPAVGLADFDDYVALEDGCLKPLPDPGPLLYNHTTVKPTFLYREEIRNVGESNYGSPVERDPIEMGEITIPVFAQDMVVLVYATILYHRECECNIKFLPKYGEQLLESDYTEIRGNESLTLHWTGMAGYINHISHGAGTEAKFRLLIKYMGGQIKVLVSALVFKAS